MLNQLGAGGKRQKAMDKFGFVDLNAFRCNMVF